MRRLKRWADRMKADVLTVWYVASDPETPWYVRSLAMFLAAYAFSPIDLIPDFIPVLGYVDDLVVLPAGVWLLIRLTPPELVARARKHAADHLESRLGRPHSIWGATLIGVAWIAMSLLILFLVRAVWPARD